MNDKNVALIVDADTYVESFLCSKIAGRAAFTNNTQIINYYFCYYQ